MTYLTQTTLAVDETAEIVATLRARFPALRGPSSDDICYATTNRQDAVRAVAREADVVLVVGSRTSSNSQRLVEVAEREGARAYLVDDETDVDVAWLAGAAHGRHHRRRLGPRADRPPPRRRARRARWRRRRSRHRRTEISQVQAAAGGAAVERSAQAERR